MTHKLSLRESLSGLPAVKTKSKHTRSLQQKRSEQYNGPARQMLWNKLSDIADASFKMHFPVGAFIVDFVSLEDKVAVLVDHQDLACASFLNTMGYAVVRVTTSQILANAHGVFNRIVMAMSDKDEKSLTGDDAA